MERFKFRFGGRKEEPKKPFGRREVQPEQSEAPEAPDHDNEELAGIEDRLRVLNEWSHAWTVDDRELAERLKKNIDEKRRSLDLPTKYS